MNPSGLIDAVFADANDFELCNALSSVIESHYGFNTLFEHHADVPHDRWVVHSVWGNTGFFACEGYSRLWGTETDQHGFAAALHEIGFPILGSVLEKALGIVPANILGKLDAVEAHRSTKTARKKAAEHLDAKLISENPDIQGRLASYIRSRRTSYADLIVLIDEQIRQMRERR